MSLTLSPIKAGFLDRVRAALADLPDDDLEEVTQDLEAHLAELSDGDVESVLGTPEDFVAEFRASAGLDRKVGGRLGRVRADIGQWEARITRSEPWSRAARLWAPVHPAWIWLRGWLGVSLFSVLAQGSDSFRAFPIPTIGNSTVVGLVAVTVATWLSVFLARHRQGSFAGFLSGTFTAVVALLLVVSLGNPRHPAPTDTFEMMAQGLISEGWNPVQNIYAFDIDGNPVEVLLYDQDGRPLLNMASYIYEEAERAPLDERHYAEFGQVRFQRDPLGRIIPNLYPLETWVYSEYGELVPSQPPPLGFPGSEAPAGAESDEEGVTTTIAVTDVD